MGLNTTLRAVLRPTSLAAALLLVAWPAAAAPPGAFTTIDLPGATGGTFPLAINPRGDIAGGYVDGTTEHGFVLTADGTLSSFDYPGALWTEIEGISPQGTIVGQYGLEDNTVHGFMVQNGTWTPIDIPGQPNTMPQRISPDGTIVGCYHVSTPSGAVILGTMHGFGLSGDTVTSDPLGRTMYNGVNPQGDIVGIYWPSSGPLVVESYIITNGATTWLAIPDAPVTQARDISPTGDVVGFYRDAAAKVHGFLLRNGELTTIDAPGATLTRAFGINPPGDIVGYYRDATGVHGFLLSSPGPKR